MVLAECNGSKSDVGKVSDQFRCQAGSLVTMSQFAEIRATPRIQDSWLNQHC